MEGPTDTRSVACPGNKKEGAPAFVWGPSQAFADRMAAARTSQVLQRDKYNGEVSGEGRKAGAEEE